MGRCYASEVWDSVFSLYGQHRKPTPEMLDKTDALLIDLQDIGARLYTYMDSQTMYGSLCRTEYPDWVLDRPNPIGKLSADGPVLKEEYLHLWEGLQYLCAIE